MNDIVKPSNFDWHALMPDLDGQQSYEEKCDAAIGIIDAAIFWHHSECPVSQPVDRDRADIVPNEVDRAVALRKFLLFLKHKLERISPDAISGDDFIPIEVYLRAIVRYSHGGLMVDGEIPEEDSFLAPDVKGIDLLVLVVSAVDAYMRNLPERFVRAAEASQMQDAERDKLLQQRRDYYRYTLGLVAERGGVDFMGPRPVGDFTAEFALDTLAWWRAEQSLPIRRYDKLVVRQEVLTYMEAVMKRWEDPPLPPEDCDCSSDDCPRCNGSLELFPDGGRDVDSGTSIVGMDYGPQCWPSSSRAALLLMKHEIKLEREWDDAGEFLSAEDADAVVNFIDFLLQRDDENWHPTRVYAEKLRSIVSYIDKIMLGRQLKVEKVKDVEGRNGYIPAMPRGNLPKELEGAELMEMLIADLHQYIYRMRERILTVDHAKNLVMNPYVPGPVSSVDDEASRGTVLDRRILAAMKDVLLRWDSGGVNAGQKEDGKSEGMRHAAE